MLVMDNLDPGKVRALRAHIVLEPVDGPGGRVFPMTALDGDKAGHVMEGPADNRRVLIDSVASQANRQELALLAAREAREIDLADVIVDLEGTEAGRPGLSTLEMPHRLADAILRDSEIDGVPFARSQLGQRILGATHGDLTPLLEVSPQSLVFGTWFSQHELGNRSLKVERASVSEIWGLGAQLGKTVGSRIDPLGILDMPIYAAQGGGWTADEAEAERKGNKPVDHRRKKSTGINHSNIPPTVSERGVICAHYELRWSLSAPAIARLRFGGPPVRDRAAQRYLMALGLLARVLSHDEGYALRSRCFLLASGPLVVEVVHRDGTINGCEIDVPAAIALYDEAKGDMLKEGFAPRVVHATPGRQLKTLIQKSRDVAAPEVAA